MSDGIVAYVIKDPIIGKTIKFEIKEEEFE